MKECKSRGHRGEVTGAGERGENIAAFFDLDGTLTAFPSLERRFFRELWYQRAIPAKNYFFWLKEALRLLPLGIGAVLHANKMVLRGVQILDGRGEQDVSVFSQHKDGHQAQGQASAPPRRIPRLPVPAFFTQAIEILEWHAKRGHEIVLMSGTLEPLAVATARALEAELAGRGIMATIRVCATRLKEMNGKWTGRVLGEAMFGEAKALAAKRLAGELRLDLARCYAYGDTANDRWLLAAVGKPRAVNPSKGLAGIARMRGWPVLVWGGKREANPRARERRLITEKERAARRHRLTLHCPRAESAVAKSK